MNFISKAASQSGVERAVKNSAPDKPVEQKKEHGKVRWHENVHAARQAARAKGKPMLVFQMMGRLDDKFC